MKTIKKILYFFTILLFISSCSEKITIPQYVTVEKLNSLKSGMSKNEVSNKMDIPPYDAYHALESGCELYSYKYVINDQKIRPIDVERRPGLKGNQAHYTQPKDVYVYFKNNRLVDLVTDGSLSYHDKGMELEYYCSGPISGCMDKQALNYNQDATQDNGSCEYCPCDQMINPNYDPVRKCGDICIPINSSDVSNNVDDDCSICDIVKNAGANTTINVQTVAPWETSNRSSSRNGINSANNSKKVSGFEKKIAKLNKALEKSKAKDAKKGKVSKKTKILQKALDKLTNNKNNKK